MYSLQKTNSFQALSKNLQGTFDSLFGLVVFSGMTGFMSIIVNSSLHGLSYTQDKPALIAAGTALPFVVMYKGLAYATKQVYKNFQKDRARVTRLAQELEKEQQETQLTPIEQYHRIEDMNDFYANRKVVDLDSYRLEPKAKQKVLQMNPNRR